MNILFLMKVFEIGGQEVVTQVLAKSFSDHNHKVSIACFEKINQTMKNRTDPRINFLQLENFRVSKKNIQTLKEYIIKNNITIIINQWGLPYIPIKILKKIKKTTDIKIISVYHNDPSTNARIKQVEIAIAQNKNLFKYPFLQLKKWLYRKVTSTSMRYVYQNSDQYQILSPAYIDRFKNFTGLKKASKLIVQINPLSIENNELVRLENKNNEIIYVGRIDYNQKRVHRCIESWAELEPLHKNWRFLIIGDGPYKQEIESLAQKFNLKHIDFKGFQEPNSYYKKAKVLILTSEYEGFPLVLAECMSFGIVPIVYDSFPAVHDIIQHGINGYIVPKVNNKFNKKEMASYIAKIMDNESLYKNLANNAIEYSKKFNIETIYQSWVKNFQALQNS